MTAYKLIRIGYDSTEKMGKEEYQEEVGIFVDEPNRLAVEKIREHFANIAATESYYLGWGIGSAPIVYPQYRIEKVELK